MKTDIFDTKGIRPMLVAEMEKPFDSDNYIYEIKWDGIRTISYLDESGVDLRNKRDIRTLQHYPELADIFKQAKTKCILDGELCIIKNGVSDFYEIQRRSIMNDPFKIRIASKKYPVTFVAFDIIYYRDKLVTDLPLMDRKELLDKTVVDSPQFCKSQFIEHNGIALFEAAKEQRLEGTVAKRKDSLYLFDKRTKNWIKSKVLKSEDFVICGYELKLNGQISYILGQYNGSCLLYKGHITLGTSMKILNQYKYHIISSPPFDNISLEKHNAVWLKPELTCIVEYMPSNKEGYRQGVCKGIRNDKLPVECQINQ